MNRLLSFNPEPFETEAEMQSALPMRSFPRRGFAEQCGCQHAASSGGSSYSPERAATSRGEQMRRRRSFQSAPYGFAVGAPEESFEMDRLEYEQRDVKDSSCTSPADVLDCSRIGLPEEPTPAERRSFKPGGALADGASDDVTGSVKDALLALHLTHYDVNDWQARKKSHRNAIAQITEFIDRYLSQNPGEAVKVTITGSASRTGRKEYNDILSCRRSKEVAKLIRLGLWGYQKNPARVIIDESGQGFCAATCKTKNDCENPDYRATLIVVHKPEKKPDPIPPETGSCLYQIRCCSFRAVLIVDLPLDWLLDQNKVQEILKKYPMLKLFVTKAYSSIKNWLKKSLKGLMSKLIETVEKYVYVEFIHVNAVFQVEDRQPRKNSDTLCYTGWGFRVKIPDVPGLDKELDEALKLLPTAARNVIKSTIKKALKAELGLQHLEGKCAPASFVPFQLSGQLQGPRNEPTCLKRRINIFQGPAAVGTDVTVTTLGASKVQLAFMNPAFALGNTRLAKCGPVCDRNSIALPLGQGTGFELFLDSRGELKPGAECNCGECTAAMRFVRSVPAGPRRILRRPVRGR
jgi:outer membrane protein OmpA-like peptidoglycan-associated protein